MALKASRQERPFRVALIGAIANPNMGDEAILEETLRLVERMYGKRCVIYVLSKNAQFTARNTRSAHVIPLDCLHRITTTLRYDVARIREEHERVLAYVPQTGENPVFEELHSVLSSIDVLHIIGGGYLNGIWPDMLEEVRLAALLAKRYGARVLATGIGVYPIEGEPLARLYEVLETCEVVDFRDASIELVRKTQASPSPRLQQTIDDAVRFGHDVPASWADQLPEDWQTMTAGRYLNISLHVDTSVLDKDERPKVLRKTPQTLAVWAQGLVERKLVDHVNLLMFARADRQIYQKFVEDSPLLARHIRIINLVDVHQSAAQWLIAHARYNVGTRYHQAVFSLAACVPTLSISISPYYRFKLDAIHSAFGSTFVLTPNELTPTVLATFEEQASSEHQRLTLAQSAVDTLYERKLLAISEAYASESLDGDELFRRMTTPLVNEPTDDEPTLSVICPLHNAGEALPALMDNLLRQTLQNLEAVCVDAASTDNTPSLLCDYASRDHRVRLLRQQHRSMARARNAGLRSARGRYVFFLEQDSALDSQSVLASLCLAARDRGVVAACGLLAPGSKGDAQGHAARRPLGLSRFASWQLVNAWNHFVYNRAFLLSHGLMFAGDGPLGAAQWFARTMTLAEVFYALEIPVLNSDSGKLVAEDLTLEQSIETLEQAAGIISLAHEHGLSALQSKTLQQTVDDLAPRMAPHLSRTQELPALERALDTLGAACGQAGMVNGISELSWMLLRGVHRAQLAALQQDEERQLEELSARHRKEVAHLDSQVKAIRSDGEAALARKEEEFRSSRTWKIGRIVSWLPRKLRDLFA